MMKKFAAIAATAAVATSMLAATVFASDATTALPWDTNGGSAKVEGDAYVVEPVIEVELPGDLAFGINPLQLDNDEDGTADAQIISGQYAIINRSNVPVLVTASTTLAGKEETVDILADADWETNGDLKPSTTDGKKSIWMAQLYPTAVAVSNGEVTLTVTDITAGTTKDADVMGQTLGATAKEVLFKLAAYGETNEQMNSNCVSGFKFAGAVDPNATFGEDDAVKVTTVFTLNTLSKNQDTKNYQTLSKGGTDYDATVVEEKAATP